MTDLVRGAVMKSKAGQRQRAQWRVVLVMLAFAVAYVAAGARMGMLALAEPEEPQLVRGGQLPDPVRGEILDRRGNLLAGNLPGWSLYADPRFIIEPRETAAKLAAILPDVPRERIEKLLTRESSFVWIKRPITPRQRQAVLELGNPGLAFAAREVRVYPSGRLAAHVLGGVRTAHEGVTFAELVGSAGVEHHQNDRLSDPSSLAEPLALSIDSAVQATVEDVLGTAVGYFGAKGGAAILMKVQTGEIVALASLPDFNPNQPRRPYNGEPAYHPRFSRAVQGVYELGSTFKPITAALAIEAGIVEPETMIDTKTPVTYGRHRFVDHGRVRPMQSVTEVVMRSSNIGTIRMAQGLGTQRFREGLKRFGFFVPTGVELAEARTARPRYPRDWTDLTTITASFGHGISISPLHLASAYATLANRGRLTRPSLIKGGTAPGEQVISPRTSAQMMRVLREVVARGTARRADVPGYELGGKTGTAEKTRPEGGYYDDRVLSTFAGVFPTSRPEYVILVSLDEPTDPDSGKREASRTAVPTTGEMLRRIAPLLGLRPQDAPEQPGYTVPVGLPADLDG
ncbi:MAG: penicillin-binding protein 2 [Pseudomonadota bacterium]